MYAGSLVSDDSVVVEQSGSREQLRHQFLAGTDWRDAKVEVLSSDASFRRYFRLFRGGDKALLMDAPPATEDLESYLKVDGYLLGAGLRAPEIFYADQDNGFAIIEDFGHQTYTQLLNAGADDKPLYQLAVDVLKKLHTDLPLTGVDCPRYDAGFYRQEAELFIDWYWPARTGEIASPALRDSYWQVWRDIFNSLEPFDECLVMRDYHVDNLMLVEQKPIAAVSDARGISSCGLLDFQDALIGSVAYDLVSLLEDARRDVDSVLAETLKSDYMRAYTESQKVIFNDWYSVMGAHRHSKVAGIFVRLCVRDDKDSYLAFMPRVLSLLQRVLTAPVMKPLAEWRHEYHPGGLCDPLYFDASQLKMLVAEQGSK